MSFDEPIEIDDVTMMFPANALEFMPAWEDIPDEHKQHTGRWEQRLWADLFFLGLEAIEFYPKDGIDPAKAWRHLRAISGSYAPQHEHKDATLSYLSEKWFEGATWQAKGKTEDTSLTPEEYKQLLYDRAQQTEH